MFKIPNVYDIGLQRVESRKSELVTKIQFLYKSWEKEMAERVMNTLKIQKFCLRINSIRFLEYN